MNDELEEEKRPDHTQGPRTRPVVRERAEQFFIEQKYVDPTTGDPYWIASPINTADPEQEIRIRIPRDANDRNALAKVLSDEWSKAKLHLVLRAGSDAYDIIGAEPSLPDQKRAVHDEKGHAFTWTNELDTKVDQYFHHQLQERIFHVQGKLVADPSEYASLAARAREVFVAEMQDAGDTRSPDELAQAFDSSISPVLDGARDTYGDAMMGRQLDTSGGVERVFYDPLVRYKAQTEVPSDLSQRTAAIANYSMQRAAFDYIHGAMCQTVTTPDGSTISFLEKVEHDLVSRRTLFGFHPTRNSADYAHLTREFSERLTLCTVQGMVRAMGGHAANDEHDHVTPNERCSRDESGRPYTLQSYLYERAHNLGLIGNFAEHEAANGDPTDYLKKLNAALRDLETEHLQAKETAIAGEMDRSMANGRTRLSDPTEAANKRLSQLAAVEKGMLSIFEETETNPPGFFG